MKRIILGITGLLLISAAVLSAESLDKVWIVEGGTDSSDSAERLEDPVVSPGQVIEVLIEEKGLSARWGEGFAYYTYTYYSDMGKKIWTSREYTEKKRTSDETWTLSVVQRIIVPLEMPTGNYRLGFELTDYHTKIVYKGSVVFTVSSSAKSEPGSSDTTVETSVDTSDTRASLIEEGTSSTESGASGAYRTMIADVELSLVSVEKTGNRLIITLRGVNRGEADEELRLYSYRTRIISEQGEEFTFSEHGGGESKFIRGLDFPPEVPMQESFSFTGPVPGKVAHIAYLEVPFYYREDKVTWRDIPIPWKAEE